MTKIRSAFAIAGAAGLLACTLAASPASAYTAKLSPAQAHALRETQTTSVHDMTYYGGPVMSYAHNYEVLWGGAGHTDSLVSGLNNFLTALNNAGSFNPYDVMIEYGTQGVNAGFGTTNQPVTSRSFYNSASDEITITPTTAGTSLTDEEVRAELVAQIAAGHLPAPQTAFGGPVTEYYVMFPPSYSICDGSDCSDVAFCAYHGWQTDTHGTVFTYAVLPESTPPDPGCGTGTANGGVDNLTSMAGHEMNESITDPQGGLATTLAPPVGWYNEVDGEDGDYCNQNDATDRIAGSLFVVQEIWSNAAGFCMSSSPLESFNPDFGSGATGAAGPLPIAFNEYGGSPNGPIASYRWDFGDGTEAQVAGAQTVHSFAPGVYTVTMIATDSHNVSGLAQHQVAVRALNVAISGPGKVTDGNGDSIPYEFVNCAASCAVNFLGGASVALRDTPADGAVFVGWGGACSGDRGCAVTLNADATVNATFVYVCMVPSVAGDAVARAQTVLKANHCSLGKRTLAYSSKVRAGRVISQRPAFGTQFPAGTAVKVVVSKGPRPLTMCHNGRTVHVAAAKKKLYLKRGYTLGACRKVAPKKHR